MNRSLLATRARHSLLAGALGDAWGGPYEGQTGAFVPAFPTRPRLSDDTFLTLATCEAIVTENGRVTPAAVAAGFRRWFEAGRLSGLGSSTLKALRDLSAGGHWALAGARGEFAAGCGAAMRVAPLGFVLDPSRDQDRVVIRDVARITHHSEEAYAGALAVVEAVRICATSGAVPRDLLDQLISVLPDTRVRDRLAELRAEPCDPETAAARFGRSGYVVEAVPLAILIATHGTGLQIAPAVERAVALGGDTDTIASIAGQIIGATGANVPVDLLSRIAGIGDAVRIVDTFTEQIRRPPC
jgi:ADP-ribosyl-[dinitrogen reductase] hydrolase